MPTDVVMPQMGESIAEGTVIRWMKKVGDKVERDEPMFEISTDKVDAEIPAPASGVLTEILAAEGATVAVNSVVARLSSEGEKAAPSPTPDPAAAAAGTPEKPAPAERVEQKAVPKQAQAQPSSASADSPKAKAGSEVAAKPSVAAATPGQGGESRAAKPTAAPAASEESDASSEQPGGDVSSLDDRRRMKSSPLVRKIANENDIDISKITGSGISGRVTKKDILQFMEAPQGGGAPAARAARASAAPPALSFAPGETVRIEPMSVMRKKIAHHMIVSKQTSAHVTTVFEVDFTEIDKLRRANKERYSQLGAKLTFLPFIVQAVIDALRQFPILNASMDGESIVFHKELNIGIAVALEWGLIVPVIKQAEEKNALGLAKAINDLGERARVKKLSPDEVQGGTFTITNPGIYGGLFGTPIINQPQLAILGVGGVKKKPVVIETDEGDAIVIRSMCHLALTFDHRLIDGALADQFMAKVKETIEDGQFAL